MQKNTAPQRTVEIFPWNDNFNTGLQEVDAQHRKLVQLINRLATFVVYTEDLHLLNGVIDELVAYTIYHFQTEEAIWHQYLQDDESEIRHKTVHQSFTREVERIRNAQAHKNTSEIVHDALGFLTRWLVSHILESDRYMGLVVQALQKGIALDDAKSHAADQMAGDVRALIDIILSMYDKLASNTLLLGTELAEKKRAETKLKLWNNVFEHAHLSLAISDARDNTLIAVNPAFAAERGYSPKELVGQPIMKLYPLDVFEDVKAKITELDTYAHGVIESEHVTRDGRRFPVMLDITVLDDEAGRPESRVVYAQDISEIKASERQVLRDNELQTTLHDLLEISLGTLPLRTLLTRCLERIFAVSWLALLPKGGIFLVAEGGQSLKLEVSHKLEPEIESLCAHVPLGRCHCGRAVQTRQMQYSDHLDERHQTSFPGIPAHGHYNVPLISGDEVLGALCLYVPAGFQRDAQLEQFILSVADIFAGLINRKHAEKDLSIAATAFESQEGMMVTDANARILRVNKAFTLLTGYTSDEVIGKTPSVLKSGRQNQEFYSAMWAKLIACGNWQGEVWNRRKNGELYPEWLAISAVKDSTGAVTHYVGAFSDITERKDAEKQILHLAFYDGLTELPNRRLLIDRLQQARVSHHRSRQHGALIYLDLDHFKLINDTLGHDYGDRLLVEVARRLQSCVREGDTVSRLGGDEFVVMLEDMATSADEAAQQAELVAEKIRTALSAVYRLDEKEVHSSTSIGVTLFLDQSDSVEELLKRADLAMYQAKTAGRNAIRFFDPAMQSAVMKRAAMEAEMRIAIEQEGFFLHYHPQVNGVGRVVAFEALARWRHPDRGLVPPAEFIPLAEECGLIFSLGQQLVRQACIKLKSWSLHPDYKDFSISVNVSPKEFHNKSFVEMLLDTVEAVGANPERLVLEITEGLLMDNLEESIVKMKAIRARGIRFSIDDFGTGYSSLAYLRKLPLDELKIDRSFIADLGQDDNAAIICATFINMAHSLGLQVVAEGVETGAQYHFLATMQKCDLMQGYLFSKPLSDQEVDHFLERSLTH